MTFFASSIAVPLLASAAAASSASGPGAAAPPSFLVQIWQGDSWTQTVYDPPVSGPYIIDDGFVTAEVTRVAVPGGDEWTLEVTAAATVDIRAIAFPFRPARRPLDADISDDVFHAPTIAGSTEHALNRNIDFSNQYFAAWPGGAFAPLVMMEDDDQARMIAATNWPPVATAVSYHAQRLEIWYADETGFSGAFWPNGLVSSVPDPGESQTYRFREINVSPTDVADAAPGTRPWHLAIDRYRMWITPRVEEIVPPRWIVETHGIHAISLHDLPLPAGDPDWIVERIQEWTAEWETQLPWVQFWGQMSDYFGDCCFPEYGHHPRYVASDPTLTEVTQQLRAQGMHVGYYASPDWTLPVDRALDRTEGQDFLENWIASHENEFAADAFYVDVVGRVVTGEPEVVRQLFAPGAMIPAAGMIEGIVDIYPSTHLLSGATIGCCGFQRHDPDRQVGWPPDALTAPNMMYPRMAPYLLPERVTFLGGGNGEALQWGAANGHVVERETFLLGAKIIAFMPDEPNGQQNAMVNAIVDAREAASWWNRAPKFVDTIGLSDVPAGIRATRFIDAAGRQLIAVDNPQEHAGQTLVADGLELSIPPTPISILTPCAADLNGDNEVGFADLLAVLSAFDSCRPSEAVTCPADLNFDGEVDVIDLLVLLASWGACGE